MRGDRAPDGSAGMRLVTGGCDNLVKIWRCETGPDGAEKWVEAATLPPSADDLLPSESSVPGGSDDEDDEGAVVEATGGGAGTGKPKGKAGRMRRSK